MIRVGWGVFRRDVRSVVPGQRIRTAIIVGAITAAVFAALFLVGGFVWRWFDGGPVRITLTALLFALAVGCAAVVLCPLGPMPTGKRLLRDSAEASPPYRVTPYFARKNRRPVTPDDRAAVLFSAERQRNWAIPRVIRCFVFGLAVVLAVIGFVLLIGISGADLFRFYPIIYGLMAWSYGIETLRGLGRVETVRLAALDVAEPPPSETGRRSHPRGSVLRLPEE
jgi:MFS family permease